MNGRMILFSVAWAVFGLGAAAQQGEAPATMDEMKQMLQAGQYQPLVAKATRVLQLKGESAKAYDRSKVLMLKGEAHLRLKQATPALDAFAAAAKEATDPKDAAAATATEALVRKSPGGKYTVRPTGGGKPEALDITDDAQRKRAFAALYADETAAAAPKLKAAARATALAPIVEAIKLAARLRSLELTADGTDEKTLASVKELGGHAESLMKEAVGNLNAGVQEISKQANTTERTSDGTGGVTTRKRGISPQQTRQLNDTIATAGKISAGAKEMSTATGVTTLAAVSTDAERVATEAQKLLDTDWDPLRNRTGPGTGGTGTGRPGTGTGRGGYGR